MRKASLSVLKNLIIATVSAILSLLILELVLQVYVTYIAGEGKLFRVDTNTGWTNLPNLNVRRLNSAGDEWIIETDSSGQRVINIPSQPQRTLLILGDSFAFGEGVNIDDRFDATITRSFPSVRIINT